MIVKELSYVWLSSLLWDAPDIHNKEPMPIRKAWNMRTGKFKNSLALSKTQPELTEMPKKKQSEIYCPHAGPLVPNLIYNKLLTENLNKNNVTIICS